MGMLAGALDGGAFGCGVGATRSKQVGGVGWRAGRTLLSRRGVGTHRRLEVLRECVLHKARVKHVGHTGRVQARRGGGTGGGGTSLTESMIACGGRKCSARVRSGGVSEATGRRW